MPISSNIHYWIDDEERTDRMLEMLKTLITDFHESLPETGVPRRIPVETVRGKASIVIGVRRCGKSTLMFQTMERLIRAGVPRENILYLNFFDDRLRDLGCAGLGQVVDEIQSVVDWEPFVDRLLRSEKCEVHLTGSSARMLSKEVATEMRGRALSWELFPFSFKEFLDFKGIDPARIASTKKRLMARKAFGEYWEAGGFPEVAAMSPTLRVKTHQEYLHAVVFRDLVERHDIAHPRAVSDLAHRLMENVASMHSINSLTGYLKSLGHRAPKAAVADYMEWFEDAFFLFSVPIFDASLARRNTNPKKIYCVDHSLVASVSSGILINSGHLLENLVFTALRRLHQKVFYYRTRSGREVDFVIPLKGRERLLVQVCESLSDPKARKREIAALYEAMAELGRKDGFIVTRDDSETVKSDGGTINVVPAWRFLLELHEPS
jgi:hypothetical protein